MPRIDSMINSDPSGIEVAAARSRAELKERWRKLPESPISFVISTSSELGVAPLATRKRFVEPGSRTRWLQGEPSAPGLPTLVSRDGPSSGVPGATKPGRSPELCLRPTKKLERGPCSQGLRRNEKRQRSRQRHARSPAGTADSPRCERGRPQYRPPRRRRAAKGSRLGA